MDVYQEPAAVVLLANHAHPVGVLLLMRFRRRGLRSLRQKPSHHPGGRYIKTAPRPGVRGRPLRVAAKKGAHLVGAAKKRLLGRDHRDVGIWREQPHDAVGIPRCEPGAEALEDLKQRGFCLRIRRHYQAILYSKVFFRRDGERDFLLS
jgi:hypothetical protein